MTFSIGRALHLRQVHLVWYGKAENSGSREAFSVVCKQVVEGAGMMQVRLLARFETRHAAASRKGALVRGRDTRLGMQDEVCGQSLD
jgi:hypothetical protein